MSGFLERLLARSADGEPAVRPRIDRDRVEDSHLATAWGEIVEEVAWPPPISRLARPNSVAGEDLEQRPSLPEASRMATSASRPVPFATTAASASTGRQRKRAPSSVAPKPVEKSAAAVATTPAHGGSTPAVPSSTASGPEPASAPGIGVMAIQPFRPITTAHAETTRTRLLAGPTVPQPQWRGGRTTDAVPDVVISIGRIEVRAPAASAPARRATAPDTSRLDEYLEMRTGQSPR